MELMPTEGANSKASGGVSSQSEVGVEVAFYFDLVCMLNFFSRPDFGISPCIYNT